MSGRPSSSSSPWPSGSSGRSSWFGSPRGRAAIFLIKLLVLIPLLFLAWSFVQPTYSLVIAESANLLLGVEEWGERVTTLRAEGKLIHVFSTLREDGQAANRYDAEVLHFYLVPCLALVLAWPRPRGWRRAALVAWTLGALFVFHSVALLITVEHTYAVALAEVARRNYGPVAAATYEWLRDSFVHFAVQLMPAAVLVALFARYGGPFRERPAGATADSESQAPREGGPRRRLLTWAIPAGPILLAAAVGLLAHLEKVHARQAESLCARAFDTLLARDPEGALPLFEDSVRLKPAFLEAWDGLGQSRLALGRHEEAESAFREALQLEFSYLPSLLGIAQGLEALGRGGEAILGLERAAALHPRNAQAQMRLGVAYARASRVEEAIPILQKALALAPGSDDALFFLAQALVSAGRPCEALPRLEEYISRPAASRGTDLVLRQLDQARTLCGS